MCVVEAGVRYTLALTYVREKDKPTAVLARLWKDANRAKIACKTALLDRYFFNVPVLKWLQSEQIPFVVPVVVRGRKPKPGRQAQGLRACRAWKAGGYDYTHRDANQSVDFRLMITYQSYQHRKSKKRANRKLMYATWKVRLSPQEARETYRKRFGIESSYRQLNQSRSRTSTRDPLYRLLLVGLSLFLRNVWVFLVDQTLRSKKRGKQAKRQAESERPPRYQDILDGFGQYLWDSTQGLGRTELLE